MAEDYFVTGLDLALERGSPSYSHWVKKVSTANAGRGLVQFAWNGMIDKDADPVLAWIDFERWVCSCPDPNCDGLELVCLEEPFFFCLSCGNFAIDGLAYPVEFPSQVEREQLYSELLKRPVRRPPGVPRSRAAFLTKSVVPGLSRSWVPGESIDDLKAQRRAAGQGNAQPGGQLPPRPKSQLRSRRLAQGDRDFSDGELSS